MTHWTKENQVLDPLQNLLQSLQDLNLSEIMPWLLLVTMAVAASYHAWKIQRVPRRQTLLKQRSERHQIDLPLFISTPVTQEFSVHTFDVSLSGAFISLSDLQKSMSFATLLGKRTGIREGDLIQIRVLLGRFSQFQCQARVVRMNLDTNNPFPKGIGIEFIELSAKNKRSLSQLIDKRSRSKAA